jgi:hypothetical protein
MDTVILRIYVSNNVQIRNQDWYVPELTKRKFSEISSGELQSKHWYLRHFIFRPPYRTPRCPKIEFFEVLSKDRKSVHFELKIEVSIPKLLYGNSLQEVKETDKDKILVRLQASLFDAGIKVEVKTIANATVSAVHFCKNIPLPPTIHMREILDELKNVDINKTVDVTETQIKNGGCVLNIYSGTTERSIYEKISDSLKTKNKRTDKTRVSEERLFVEELGLQNCEVFRYEYRIKKTQTVKRELNKVLGRKPLTPVIFEDLFSPNTFRNVVNKSWKNLIENPVNQLALIGPINKLALFIHILEKARQQGGPCSLNNALIAYGLTTSTKELGAKEIRGIIGNLWNKNHGERFTKKIVAAAELAKGLPVSNNISFIDVAIEKFELVTVAALQAMIK